MPNKAEEQGRQARRDGKGRYSPHDKWFPSDTTRRNDADWKIGYDKEDKSRKEKSKKE